MIDVGTRSAYVASAFAARRMTERRVRPDREHQLVGRREVRVARRLRRRQGGARPPHRRHRARAARPRRRGGVALARARAHRARREVRRAAARARSSVRSESQRFTGRAVAALAADPDVLRHTGRALASRDLADLYGFTDVDGSLPDGPLQERPYARMAYASVSRRRAGERPPSAADVTRRRARAAALAREHPRVDRRASPR